ncbi:MAG: hypothetical protein JNK38_01025 [Acidobacteria bacterium]|nr:hypothetical protein [Acidobacteriota bacterium]
MEIWIAIGIPLFFLGGAGIGYLFGRLDQRNWLAEQYKVACWQRDQAIQQRDRARAERMTLYAQVHHLQSEVNRIWNAENHPTN